MKVGKRPRPKTSKNWKNPVILTTTRRAFFPAFPAVSRSISSNHSVSCNFRVKIPYQTGIFAVIITARFLRETGLAPDEINNQQTSFFTLE